TNGRPVRAVTFQSIDRTSSPGTYSRTSSKSMPRPLKTEWYWPANVSCASRFVRISRWRTLARISRGVASPLTVDRSGPRGAGGRRASRHRDAVEDAAHDVLAPHVLGVRLVRHDDAVAQHVHADRLHVLRGHVAAALQERPRLRGHRQVDRRAR